MTDFAAIWNSRIGADKKASVFAGLTEEAVNNYLLAHRKFDGHRYIVQRVFKDAGKEKLKLTLIVGGNKQEHNAGKGLPLSVRFPTAHKDAPVSDGYRSAYAYSPQHVTYTYDQLAAHLPNIVLSAKGVNLYMEWPNSSGGAWSHHQDGIDFELKAKIDLVEDNERLSISFTPVELHVSKTSELALREGIQKAIAKATKVPTPEPIDPKIADLFMATVELAATAVGPDLVTNIQVPVLELGKFVAIPTALSLGDGVVSVAAHLDVSSSVAAVRDEIDVLQRGLLVAFRRDLEESGGALGLLYEQQALTKAGELPVNERYRFLLDHPTRSAAQIEKHMKWVSRYTANELAALRRSAALRGGVARKAKGGEKRVLEGLGVAVNEDTFDRLVSDVGGIARSGFTERLDLLAIRGRLGYELKLGTPDITITAANQLQGSIFVDVFAGVYYQVREALDCSWRWSDEYRLGLGVKGTPKLKISTRKANGLSIWAQIDLGGLEFQTGLGLIIDGLVNLLLGPFKAAIELVLNAILGVLSFVIVPAAFKVLDQNTGLSFSKFSTTQYLRKGANDPSNNFLLIKSDVAGVDLGQLA